MDNNKIKDKFTLKIRNELKELYLLEDLEAQKLIDKSFIKRLIEENIDYVAYYSPDYWASEIYKDSIV